MRSNIRAPQFGAFERAPLATDHTSPTISSSVGRRGSAAERLRLAVLLMDIVNVLSVFLRDDPRHAEAIPTEGCKAISSSMALASKTRCFTTHRKQFKGLGKRHAGGHRAAQVQCNRTIQERLT